MIFVIVILFLSGCGKDDHINKCKIIILQTEQKISYIKYDDDWRLPNIYELLTIVDYEKNKRGVFKKIKFIFAGCSAIPINIEAEAIGSIQGTGVFTPDFTFML